MKIMEIRMTKCKNCKNELEGGDNWVSNDGYFCSMECIARWYGDEVSE